MQHIIKRVAATPLRIKSDMSWLGVSRGRVSSMCIVEVETDSGHVGHGVTYLADGGVVAQAVNGVLAPIGRAAGDGFRQDGGRQAGAGIPVCA